MKKILGIIMCILFSIQSTSANQDNLCYTVNVSEQSYYGVALGETKKHLIDTKINIFFTKIDESFSSSEEKITTYEKIIDKITVLKSKESIKSNTDINNLLGYLYQLIINKIDSIENLEQCLLDNLLNVDSQESTYVENMYISFDGEDTISWNNIDGVHQYEIWFGTYSTLLKTLKNSYTIPSKTDVGNDAGELSDIVIKAYNKDNKIIAKGETEVSYQTNHCKYRDEFMSSDVYHNQEKYSYGYEDIYGGEMSYKKNFKCEFGEIIFLNNTDIDVACDSGFKRNGNSCEKYSVSTNNGERCIHGLNYVEHGKKGGFQEEIIISNGKKYEFVNYTCTDGTLYTIDSSFQSVSCNSGYVAAGEKCEKIDINKANCLFTDDDSTLILSDKESKWTTKDLNIRNGMNHSNVFLYCSDGDIEIKRQLFSYTTCTDGYYNNNGVCKKASNIIKGITILAPEKVLRGETFEVSWEAPGYKYCSPYGSVLESTDGYGWTNSLNTSETTSISGNYSAFGSKNIISSSNINVSSHTISLTCYTHDGTNDTQTRHISVVDSLASNEDISISVAVINTFGDDDKYATIEFDNNINYNIVDSVEILEIKLNDTVSVRNDDGEDFSFPEEVNNGDQWELKATIEGEKILESITYKITFEKDPSSTQYIEPIIKTKTVGLKLGTYYQY